MLITDQLTPHFRASELAEGRARLPDDPEACANLAKLAATLLEPLRVDWEAHIHDDNLGGMASINIVDGYRSPAENARVGGASKSQHMIGCAADICADVHMAALRDGQGTDRDARRMQDFATFVERWARSHDACGGLGIYTAVPSGQLYWVHVDIRTHANGLVVWSGHHVGSEQ